MSIKDLIGDYKPSANAEDSFDPFKGKYEVVIDKLEVGTPREEPQNFDRYKMTLKVTKNISGDKAEGRLLFKTYMKNDADKVKQLLNDLFTMGCTPTLSDSDEEFEAQFPMLVGAKGFVNAYHFKPEKTMDGTPIPEDERKPIQIAKIYAPDAKAKDKAAGNEEVPF
jgi:hypothetical protein